jgi:HK97 gp10 family phage protein
VATGLVSAKVVDRYKLRRQLKRLPDNIRKKVVRSMNTAGGTVIAKAARKEVPVKSGLLKGSIIRVVRKAGTVVAIGPEFKKAPHDHLVHDGTQPHSLGRIYRGRNAGGKRFVLKRMAGNQHPGSRPDPYMLRAMDKTRQAVFTKMAQVATKRIAKLRSK